MTDGPQNLRGKNSNFRVAQKGFWPLLLIVTLAAPVRKGTLSFLMMEKSIVISEDKKKSMLSSLSPEAVQLFSLLSAQDWQHWQPKLNSFMKQFVSDKDLRCALGTMQTQTKK
jgi:hypothetical protein